MNLRERWRGILMCATAAVTAVVLFVRPQMCRDAAAQGLQLCGGPLLIGIFPFLIVSKLIADSGCAAMLARPLHPLARLLGCRHKAGAAVLLLGGAGGFASAASAAADLYNRNEITGNEASLLLAAAAGSSPAFVILTVGQQMLGSQLLGIQLYLAQLLAAYLSVFCYRVVTGRSKRQTDRAAAADIDDAVDIGDRRLEPRAVSHTAEAIGAAALTYLKLCGFIVYFRIISVAVSSFFSAETAFLPLLLLEVSSGCNAAALRPIDAVYWCCAALSLQGGSVLLQIRAICPAGISLAPLLWIRPVHLALSLLFLRTMLQSSTTVDVLNSLESRIVAMPRLSPECALLLFGACLLVCTQLCHTLQAMEK